MFQQERMIPFAMLATRQCKTPSSQAKGTKPTLYTELNDLRKNICLRKSEGSVERISVYYVIEKLTEHGIHCLPCLYINDVISLLP